MGKGDQKSRRGKIIIGSSGVRRPKPSKRKVFVKAEVAVPEKVAKVIEKPKAEPKPKVKAAEAAVITETEPVVAPVKAVKKAVKKAKSDDATE